MTTVSTQWVTRDITSQCIVRSTGLPSFAVPPPVAQQPVNPPVGPSPGASVYSSAPAVASLSDDAAPSSTTVIEATPSVEGNDDSNEGPYGYYGGFGYESD